MSGMGPDGNSLADLYDSEEGDSMSQDLLADSYVSARTASSASSTSTSKGVKHMKQVEKWDPAGAEEAIEMGSMQLELKKCHTQLEHANAKIQSLQKEARLREDLLTQEKETRRGDGKYYGRMNCHLEDYVQVMRQHHGDMKKMKEAAEMELESMRKERDYFKEDRNMWRKKYEELKKRRP